MDEAGHQARLFLIVRNLASTRSCSELIGAKHKKKSLGYQILPVISALATAVSPEFE